MPLDELVSRPAAGPAGRSRSTFTNVGVDKEHVVLIRDSVQGSGNRTLAIGCGWQSNGASGALGRDRRTAARSG